MRSGSVHLCSAAIALFIMVLCPAFASADCCLLAYPDQNAVFHFDPSHYRMILPGDSLYDPAYNRFGVMLWDIENDRIAYELYQAPGLIGFEPASHEANVFNFPANRFTLHIDGFFNQPRRLNDIYVRFLPTPYNAQTTIYANDDLVSGLYYHIPQLVVSTPLGNGFYSDTIDLEIVWSGAEAMKITVFSDKNGNRAFDGEERYNVFMPDQTVPAQSSTWGQIKAQYE
jgi:hypothetical protein